MYTKISFHYYTFTRISECSYKLQNIYLLGKIIKEYTDNVLSNDAAHLNGF